MSADAIVTGGEDAIRALQQATKTIPIVALADDMLGNGFVNSLSRPNGNTTGVSILAQVLDGKRQDIEALQTAARAHDVELLILRVTQQL